MNRLQDLLENIPFVSDPIRKWFLGTYKNHCFRNHLLPTIEDVLHIQDFLNSDTAPKNLEGKTVGNILSAMDTWERTKIQVEGYTQGEKLVFEKDGFQVFQLTSKEALIEEGNIMQHCIGKSSTYIDGLRTGASINFSVRLGTNRLATFEIQKHEELYQVKGPRNSVPDKSVVKVIVDFCNQKGFTKSCSYFMGKDLNITSLGDRIILVEELQPFLNSATYIHSLRLRKDHGFVVIPKGLHIEDLHIESEAVVKIEEGATFGVLYSYRAYLVLPKVLKAKRANLSHVRIPKETFFDCPNLTFYGCFFEGVFPKGNYGYLEFMSSSSDPEGSPSIVFEGEYTIRQLYVSEIQILGNYHIKSSMLSSFGFTFPKDQINTKSLHIGRLISYKLDKEYSRLTVSKINTLRGFSQKEFQKLDLDEVGLKFLPATSVKEDLTLSKVLGLEMASNVETGNLSIKDSSVILPRELVVHGNLKIHSSSFEKWPEKLIVHGDLTIEGDNYPPLHAGIQVQGDLYISFSNLNTSPK